MAIADLFPSALGQLVRRRDVTRQTELLGQLMRINEHVVGQELLGTVCSGRDTLAGAVLEQARFAALRAVGSTDHLAMRCALEMLGLDRARPSVVDHAGTSILVADRNSGYRIEDERFDSPIVLLTASSAHGATPDQIGAVRAALDFVSALDLDPLIHFGASVLVLGEQIGTASTSASYSVGILPRTLFIDWAPDPLLMAEGIVHESAHAWLNLCLAAADARIDAEPIAVSPWTGTMRPAYGFVHATMAFSALTVLFAAALISGAATGWTADYCEVRTRLEANRLAISRRHLDTACKSLRCDVASDLVRTWRAEALALSEAALGETTTATGDSAGLYKMVQEIRSKQGVSA